MARPPLHVEVVAADEVEVGHEAIGLGAERGLGLVSGRLGQAHRRAGQLGELVQKGVLSLHGPYMARRGMKAKGFSSKP